MHDVVESDVFQILHSCTLTHGVDILQCISFVAQFEAGLTSNEVGLGDAEVGPPHVGACTVAHRRACSLVEELAEKEACLVDELLIALQRTVH